MIGSVCFHARHRDVSVVHDGEDASALALASELWAKESTRTADRTCPMRLADCDFSPFSPEYKIIKSDGLVRFVESDG